jgi:hypothetical protein
MSEWKSIESAPKGQILILYFPKETTGNRNAEWVCVDWYPVRFPREPSHWMPLPDPPSEPRTT